MATRAEEGSDPALDVNMTPLIDVTFLLLIFFMIISIFNKMESMAELELPKAFQAQIMEGMQEGRLVVNVEGDGQIVVFAQRMGVAGFRRMLQKHVDALQQLAKKSGEAAIVIRGDQDTVYEDIKQVIDIVKDYGFRRIMFAAYQMEEDE